MITDFRGINKMLLRPVYLFESTKTILENIPSDNTYFAVLDMIQENFQVPLDQETSNLTVFINPYGKYHYLHPPMGLAPSSYWFNTFMSALVQRIQGISKSMDYFFASANSLEKLEKTLDKFLRKCEELGVKIPMKKFKMGSKGKFGRFLVTNDEGREHIKADPGKLEIIREFPRLLNRDNVTSFIGLVKTSNNWSRALSVKMEKLRELNQKGVEFNWLPEHTEEFKKVKEHVMQTTKLTT